MSRTDIKAYFPIVSAAWVLACLVIGAYIAIDRKVTVLAEAALTPASVEHIVDLKTEDKLEAIQAALARIEGNLNDLARRVNDH